MLEILLFNSKIIIFGKMFYTKMYFCILIDHFNINILKNL